MMTSRKLYYLLFISSLLIIIYLLLSLLASKSNKKPRKVYYPQTNHEEPHEKNINFTKRKFHSYYLIICFPENMRLLDNDISISDISSIEINGREIHKRMFYTWIWPNDLNSLPKRNEHSVYASCISDMLEIENTVRVLVKNKRIKIFICEINQQHNLYNNVPISTEAFSFESKRK